MFLEVDVANDAARSLYEGMQFSVVGRRGGYYRNPAQTASDALTLRADLPLPSMGKIGESR
jgi:ribosomal protein S18 acetylase RimI-like enzyme